ncbi:MAG: alpha/beta hydrolase [Dehalococcoidia bacterium]
MTDSSGDLTLRLTRVAAAPSDEPGAIRVLLETTRGPIEGVMHPVEGGSGALICVSGAMGGLDGPNRKLYRRLAPAFVEAGVTTLRLNYRKPNEFEECLMDVMAGCSFLRGIGATDVVLAGHSFGAAVVIKAAELAPLVRGVVSMSPQLYGTRQIELMERPLLLVHGTADSILSHDASEDIYKRANDPKQIVLIADTGHSLDGGGDALDELLLRWVPERLRGEPMQSGRSDWMGQVRDDLQP